MSQIETKVRLVSDIEVCFHSQLPERMYEHPVPHGIVGIRVWEEGRSYVEILNQEVAIYTRGFPGDQVKRRLAATMSIDDAGSLTEKLQKVMKYAEKAEKNPLPTKLTKYNPDDYPQAKIIKNPSVEIGEIPADTLELPYPIGVDNSAYWVTIMGDAPNDDGRIPVMLLTTREAGRLIYGIRRILDTMPTRGKGIIKTEEIFGQKRIVYF